MIVSAIDPNSQLPTIGEVAALFPAHRWESIVWKDFFLAWPVGFSEVFFGENFSVLKIGMCWIFEDGRPVVLSSARIHDLVVQGVLPDSAWTGGNFLVLIIDAEHAACAVWSDFIASIPFHYSRQPGFCGSLYVSLIELVNRCSYPVDSEKLDCFDSSSGIRPGESFYTDVRRAMPGLQSIYGEISLREVVFHHEFSGGLQEVASVLEVGVSGFLDLNPESADVPVQLSGGMDSTLLALCIDRSGRQLVGFHQVYPQDASDELREVRLNLLALRSSSSVVLVPVSVSRAKKEENNMRMIDFPVNVTSFLSPALAESVKKISASLILFNGCGGDEVFASLKNLPDWERCLPFRDFISVLFFYDLSFRHKVSALYRFFRKKFANPSGDQKINPSKMHLPRSFENCFYHSQWQIYFMHGLLVVTPLRCALLTRSVMARDSVAAYWMNGRRRGLQNELLRRLSNGRISKDVRKKVNFNGFVCDYLSCEDKDRRRLSDQQALVILRRKKKKADSAQGDRE
jgi:hypothetical protein